MNHTAQILTRIALLVFIVAVLGSFPWPDITPYLVVIEYIFGFLYFFNPIVDMDSAFAFAILIAGIESSIYLFQTAILVFNFINTGHWKTPEHVGDGTVGGPGDTHPRYTPGL